MLSLQRTDWEWVQVWRPLFVCSWGRRAAAILALIVAAIVGWCIWTRLFVFAIGAAVIIFTAGLLTIYPSFIETAFARPRHIEDLTEHQIVYFRSVVIILVSVFFGFAIDYICFQLKSSALTWFEVFGIIGGSLSFLVKFTRATGSLVLFCLPKQENAAPFPIGIPI